MCYILSLQIWSVVLPRVDPDNVPYFLSADLVCGCIKNRPRRYAIFLVHRSGLWLYQGPSIAG